jgi:predicted outer membrane protein
MDKVEALARRVDDQTATTQRELRDDVYAIEIRVNERMRTLDQDLRDTRKELEEKMQIILDNPLNNP